MKITGKYAGVLADMDVNPAHFVPEGTSAAVRLSTLADLENNPAPLEKWVEQYIDSMLAEYGLRQISIRPLVLLHDLVLGAHAGESFRIAVTGKPDYEAANAFNAGCRKIHTLASVGSMHEAVAIAADLRSPYLRHYPGRCFRNTGETNFDTNRPAVAYVYVAFFDKAHGNAALADRGGIRLEWT